MPSKFIKTSKQLCDSTHVFLEAEPTLIYIEVLHSSFLLWCCFWKKKGCETDCFLSSSVQIAVCTPALEAVWAQPGLAIGGGEERTRVHCHPLQTLPPRSVPLSSFTSPTMMNKLPVELYNWFVMLVSREPFHGPGFPYPRCHWENTSKQTSPECGVLPGESPAAAKPCSAASPTAVSVHTQSWCFLHTTSALPETHGR